MGIYKYAGTFAAGLICGAFGDKVLSNPMLRKAVVNVAAAGLRAKDGVIAKTVSLQENAEDILAEAKALNAVKAEMKASDESGAAVVEAAL